MYNYQRTTGALRWYCKACRKDFSVTSGARFAIHKVLLRSCLAAIAILINKVTVLPLNGN